MWQVVGTGQNSCKVQMQTLAQKLFRTSRRRQQSQKQAWGPAGSRWGAVKPALREDGVERRAGQTVTSWMSFHLQRKPREEPELQQALTWCPSLSHGLAAGRSLRRGGEGRGRGSRGCGVAWAQTSGDGGRRAGCRKSCWTGCRR